MKTIFFASDAHFWHKNIIEYDKRPYESVEEMNYRIIRNWCSVVRPDDDVYYLGDFSFSNKTNTLHVLNQLTGNIHFIRGNHDQVIDKNPEIQKKFVWYKDYHELYVPDKDADRERQRICLFHFPIASWHKIHEGAWHLHGHTHGSFPEKDTAKYMDVGLNCIDYTPISYEQVKKRMSKKQFKAVEHHT